MEWDGCIALVFGGYALAVLTSVHYGLAQVETQQSVIYNSKLSFIHFDTSIQQSIGSSMNP